MIRNPNRLTGEKQPAYYIVRDKKLSIADVATACGVGYLHLRNALYGLVRPRREVLEKLPAILGVDSAEKLFDTASLSAAHDPRKAGRNTLAGAA